MMDFDSKAVLIGVNFQELKYQTSGKHFFVDSVFIDKSNAILHPLLYQLNQDLEQFKRQGYLPLEGNAFAMIGEVLSIDKQKKQIYLKNQDSVTYKYLITATGLSQTQKSAVHDEEMTAGFHTLSEALRIRKNTEQLQNRSSFHPESLTAGLSHALTLQKTSDENVIRNLIKTLSSFDLSKPLEIHLAGVGRRLYEVQL